MRGLRASMADFGKLCRNQWDRTAAVVLAVAGFVALLAGWSGARDADAVRQVPFLLSGGLTGVCLVAVGTALWLSADLRDEWRKLDRIEALLDRDGDATGRVDVDAATTTPVDSVAEERSLQVAAKS